MAGEKDLEKLLLYMAPQLIDGVYVFCSIKNAAYGDFAEARPIASFAETEGLSLVLLKSAADELGWSYNGVFRCISLGIHSSLDAVGLTAAVSATLANNGISANVIAAYYHDHVFVQTQLADQAIGLLLKDSRQDQCS